MTPEEYQDEVGRFDNHRAGAGVFPFVLGLTAEAGEVANEFERHMRKGGWLNLDNVKLELGDVMWNLAMLANKYGWTLSEIMQENIDKLDARYEAAGIG